MKSARPEEKRKNEGLKMLTQPFLKKRKIAEDEQDSEMADVTEKDEKRSYGEGYRLEEYW